MAMSYFDLPPGQRVLREFAIRRDQRVKRRSIGTPDRRAKGYSMPIHNQRGRWVASEAHGLLGGVFLSCKEAFRFALYEADGDAARVHVEPSSEICLINGR
jgi:hypothetical protein